ncbi:MAG: type VI secretion system baseplate subunit TssG [Bryobacteraceae bacterium]|nr:type VI secretion system baseplate subunit TssG [Bryobacteraceae bacterium]
MSVMPDLAQSYHGFHHTVDSALEVLANLNVSAHRITLRMAGRGLPSRWIVSQTPAAGKPLGEGETITLEVAGLGYFHNLPVALWESGGESRMGTREIVAALDDPYQKAAHWLREGARLFDISPTNLDACGRWITLFGLNPEDWPTDKWYSLAVLLPNLQSLAGKETGIRFALSLMLDLPLERIARAPRFRELPEDELSRLGRRYARLGVDAIAGNRIEDLAELTLVLGPVTLDTYYAFAQEDRKLLLDQVLYLVTPCHQRYRVAWSVEDRRKAPHLGVAALNSRLGLNSYLGAQA